MGSTVSGARAGEGQDRRDEVVASAWLWPKRALDAVCTAFALTGGLVLMAFMLVSVGSIVSRSMFGTPLLGDYEITERGSAISVFLILPYCHLHGGHVVVDMFVGMLPKGMRRWLTLLGEVLFAAVSAMLTWRLAVGGYELFTYNDASMMLSIPTWWMFVPVVASMGLLTVVCVARAAAALNKERVA